MGRLRNDGKMWKKVFNETLCDKYKLPKEVLIAEREKYGKIPNTIEECENYGK